VTYRLPYRAPYNFAALLAFLGPRALAGHERITAGQYERDGVRVQLSGGEALHVIAPAARLRDRVRHIFDVDADPSLIDTHLTRSPLLRPIVARHAGIRVPGCWDGFELIIRAILGQQVTVKGATTLMNRLITRWGLPDANVLANAPVEEIGLPAKRAESIRAVATAVRDGALSLHPGADASLAIERMCSLPGIGPWTAHYTAMRALKSADAFPASDLGLLKASQAKSPRELERISESWRPYRAYAALYLWRSLSD
jgi:3-methyladenine DNA glycosylase/8-oxoguanine DNA glycosylase